MSNIYLDPLDHLMARSGFEMIRYADDFVILCRTPEEASRALELVQGWVTANGPDPASDEDKGGQRADRRF